MTINSSGRPFGADGQAADPAVLQACRMVAGEVVDFARLMLAARAQAVTPQAV